LDPESLAGLLELADDGDDFVADLFRSYAQSYTDCAAGMRAHLEAGDAMSFSRSAHTLKGASANVGASHLAALAEEMQHVGEAGDLEGALVWLQAIEAEWVRVRAAIEASVPGF
jgi:HPt (histidine-containing phosphotransfer) domain-containing protein